MNDIAKFLAGAEVLKADAAKAAGDLVELRNQYAHARGKNPEADAVQAIKHLHALVEGTVSVFHDYQLTDSGGFVRKGSAKKE